MARIDAQRFIDLTQDESSSDEEAVYLPTSEHPLGTPPRNHAPHSTRVETPIPLPNGTVAARSGHSSRSIQATTFTPQNGSSHLSGPGPAHIFAANGQRSSVNGYTTARERAPHQSQTPAQHGLSYHEAQSSRAKPAARQVDQRATSSIHNPLNVAQSTSERALSNLRAQGRTRLRALPDASDALNGLADPRELSAYEDDELPSNSQLSPSREGILRQFGAQKNEQRPASMTRYDTTSTAFGARFEPDLRRKYTQDETNAYLGSQRSGSWLEGQKSAAQSQHESRAPKRMANGTIKNPTSELSGNDLSSISNIKKLPMIGTFASITVPEGRTSPHQFRHEMYPDRDTTTFAPKKSVDAAAIRTVQSPQVQRSPKSTPGRRVPFTEEENNHIIQMKEEQGLPWDEILRHFPTRTKGTIQVHYSTKLRPEKRAAKVYQPAPVVQPLQSRPRSVVPTPPAGASFTPINAVQRRHGSRRRTTRQDLTQVFTDDVFQSNVESFDQAASKAASVDTIESEANLEPRPKAFHRIHRLLDSRMANTGSTARKIPARYYLADDERRLLNVSLRTANWETNSRETWNAVDVHHSLDGDELFALEALALEILRPKKVHRSRSVAMRMRYLLGGIAEHQINAICQKARTASSLSQRDTTSIAQFLRDASAGRIESTAKVSSIAVQSLDHSPAHDIAQFLRQRELGHVDRRSLQPPAQVLTNKIKNRLFDTMEPTMSFTGMGNDVNTVAWSPAGNIFAAGSVCTTDAASMQYNRGRNLFLGNVEKRTLRDLPDHHTVREKAESGANATHSMHVSQDTRLFSTITMVEFSPDGQSLYSAGYDNHLRVWQTSATENANPLILGLQHKGKIDVLTVSRDGLIATGCQHPKPESAINVIRLEEDPAKGFSALSKNGSQRAVAKPQANIVPSCLRFEPLVGRHLLGGFSSSAREGEEAGSNGDVCVFDIAHGVESLKITSNSRNTFDCAWSPVHWGRFAIGCVAGMNVNPGCRTTVRVYDFHQQNQAWRAIMEMENKALDINDVTFCPYDENYIAAGCTDGTAYIWDMRRPDAILHKLQHGKSLMPLDGRFSREVTDTGVRFLSWGENRTRLFSGSSDGVIKLWDVTQPSNSVLVKDVATYRSGVMCASFSPDKSSLLVGEVNSTIDILGIGLEQTSNIDNNAFRVIDSLDTSKANPDPDASSGIAASRSLLNQGIMQLKPMGGLPIRQAVQGPAYDGNGPVSGADDAEKLRALAATFQSSLIVSESAEPCDIEACRKSHVRLLEDDMLDSGRSKDRIPDTLRCAKPLDQQRPLPGLAKCSVCGRQARPRITDFMLSPQDLASDQPREVAAQILCELCSFSCIRCGAPAGLSKEVDVVWCFKCGLDWNVDVLGYQKKTRKHWSRQQKSESGFLTEMHLMEGVERAQVGVEDIEQEGDELNDLVGYYNSLWGT